LDMVCGAGLGAENVKLIILFKKYQGDL